MDKLEALEIIWELAVENALDDPLLDVALREEKKRQHKALDITHIMIGTLKRQKKILKGKEVKTNE